VVIADWRWRIADRQVTIGGLTIDELAIDGLTIDGLTIADSCGHRAIAHQQSVDPQSLNPQLSIGTLHSAICNRQCSLRLDQAQ
jgi:hypothetical protein